MHDRLAQLLVPSILSLVISMVAPVRAATVDFNRDIRPILTQNCFKCHGFDPAGRKGGLRLDIPAGTLTKLKTGHIAIVPGKPDDSELVHRITSLTEDEVMPPPESGKKLTPQQIATLRQWVAEGGAYAKHWSFEPPVKSAASRRENCRHGRGMRSIISCLPGWSGKDCRPRRRRTNTSWPGGRRWTLPGCRPRPNNLMPS